MLPLTGCGLIIDGKESVMKSSVAIVLLNWNGQKVLEQFLPSVVKYSEGACIYIVDNGSTDNSVRFLRENYPNVSIILLPKNYGFAEGYNRGLKQIEATYYILLNTDVEVTSNWYQPLLALLESSKEIVAVQPKILSFRSRNRFEYAGASGGFLDALGYPFCRGRILDVLEEDYGQYDEKREVFWATGAALAIKADAFHSVGGFDNDFFAHMEEIDLCWRLQKLGGQIYCEPKSIVYHLGGGTLPNESSFKLFLNFRNNLYMLYKNLPKYKIFSIIFFRILLDWGALLKFILEGKLKYSKSIFRAHWYFFKSLQKLHRKREEIQRTSVRIPRMKVRSILWMYFFRKKKYFSDLRE